MQRFKNTYLFVILLCLSFSLKSSIVDSLSKRKPTEKFVYVTKLESNLHSVNDNIRFLYLSNSEYTQTDLDLIEKNTKDKSYDEEVKNGDSEKRNKFYSTYSNLSSKKMTNHAYDVLKMKGYVDTVNYLFYDKINSILMEGRITNVNIYVIPGKKREPVSIKTKLNISWVLKNSLHELIDSVDNVGYSSDLVTEGKDLAAFMSNSNSLVVKIINEAIDNSVYDLFKKPGFVKYMPQQNEYVIADPLLTLTTPTAVVGEKSDASFATVIVKSKEGHASGFAITNDGYIITNYHVVEEDQKNKIETVKIITSGGDELEGKIIRVNKMQDLALLKVNKGFEKAFKVPVAKSYKNLQDVFTLGAPKSIELGQSIAAGIISVERKQNHNYLIQLGMAVNSGNSGGALFDAQGNLHGVIYARLSGQNTEGIGFAIPAFLLGDYLKINFK
jgi:S1-C subfamily serine protease